MDLNRFNCCAGWQGTRTRKLVFAVWLVSLLAVVGVQGTSGSYVATVEIQVTISSRRAVDADSWVDGDREDAVF